MRRSCSHADPRLVSAIIVWLIDLLRMQTVGGVEATSRPSLLRAAGRASVGALLVVCAALS